VGAVKLLAIDGFDGCFFGAGDMAPSQEATA
jgi:2-keto-3-deoxy-L-rhamnonate aldolase RhmA